MKKYPVGIVGESNYQSAIRGCRVGEPVEIAHELGNPHDEEALVVLTASGKVIGYVGRGSWLCEAVHGEGQGCTATILSIDGAKGGDLGVVVEVSMNQRGLSTRRYSDRAGGCAGVGAIAMLSAAALVTAAFAGGAAVAQKPDAPSSGWRVEQESDPMTDRVEVRTTLRGEGGEVVVLCSPGQRPVLAFQPDGFLGAPVSRYEWRDFSYRFDDLPLVTTQWKYSNGLAVAPSDRAARRFLDPMMRHRVLRVRAIGYDNRAHDATFNLDGAESALREAAAICG